MKKLTINILIAAILAASLLGGCSATNTAATESSGTDTPQTSVSDSAENIETSAKDDSNDIIGSNDSVSKTSSSKSDNTKTNTEDASSTGILDTSDMFSKRDLEQTADTSSAKAIKVADNKTIDITEEGVYVISGSAKNCTIKVNSAKEAKVQLVLDGVTITNDSSPAIYVVSADKCFVTTTDSKNELTVTGTFTADGDTNTDAVIYSKDDLVLNGKGTLTITSTANGISCKDDLKITGGTYNIKSDNHAIEGKDSIRISQGTFTISASKDGLHSDNEEDTAKGYIYISDGSFDISAGSDAIQAITVVQIDGGTFDLDGSEGIEGTYIQINGGTIKLYATDDGINATQKSDYSTPTIEVNGGELTIEVAEGDTDGLDANGNIIVNGGTIDVTAQMSSFDYDGTAEFNGGTIIVNGSEVDSIPQSMMGGPGGMMGGGPGGMMGGNRGNMNGGFGGRMFN